MPIYYEGHQCYDLRTEGEEINILLNDGRVVYMRDPDPATWNKCPLLIKGRHVEESGANGFEKWYEIGLELPASFTAVMTGNSAAGWSICGNLIQIHLEHSETLTQWALGRFPPSPHTPTTNGNPNPELEILTHWCRSIYPVDSKIKTGQIVSIIHGEDARIDRITSLKINGVLQALPRYPYMLTNIAAFAVDLAVLWPGATATSTGPGNWDIRIPNVPNTTYGAANEIWWPRFLVPNIYGDVVNPCDHTGLPGEFVNAGGVRTHLEKQFTRAGLRINANSLESAINAWLVFYATI